MRIKAIILTLIFLLGGSGLNINIAQCCDKFAGLGLSFAHPVHEEDKECCACIEAMQKSSCCEDISVHTVINSVLGLEKNSKSVFGQPALKVVQYVEQRMVIAPSAVQFRMSYKDLHLNDPVPVLIKKRVLQI